MSEHQPNPKLTSEQVRELLDRKKSEPPVQVQDTIITAWTIRHPTRNRNDPIARAELYQLSYIPPSQVGACIKESSQSSILFLGAVGRAILDLNQRPRP
ncbi:hypothetical protein RYX36_028851 [Vicia faba]